MTLAKNQSNAKRFFILLMALLTFMSLMSLPVSATPTDAITTGAAAIELRAELTYKKNATVLLDGAQTESVTVKPAQAVTLEVTPEEGYFIKKIALVSTDAQGNETETIVSLADDSYFSGTISAEMPSVLEISISSDSFRFFDSFLDFDLGVFAWVNSFRGPVLNAIFKVITTLGDEGIIFIAMALVLLFTKKYRKIGFTMLGALAIMLVCNNLVLKEIFARERPFNLYEIFPEKYAQWGGEAGTYFFPNIVSRPHSLSFPSGHTSSAFAAAIAVLFYDRKIGIPTTVFAFFMGFSRIYVGVHYCTDVIAGAIVGCIYALMAVLAAKFLFPVFEKILDIIASKIFKKKA